MPVGSRHVSSPPSPSHRDRLQEELKGVHSRFHIKEVADFSLTRVGRLLRLRSDSPHGGHLRLPRSDSLQRGHPHLSEWDSLQTQGLAPPGDPFLGIHALQGYAPPGIPSLQREVPPSPKRRRYESRDSVSPHQHHSSRSGTVFRRSHRTVGSNRSATTDPFPPLESDLPVPQLTMWLLSTDSPVSPAFLRQVIHDFPSFKGRSDLWIFKLDGLPL